VELWGFESDALSDVVRAAGLMRRMHDGARRRLSVARQFPGNVRPDGVREIADKHGRWRSFAAAGGIPATMAGGNAR